MTEMFPVQIKVEIFDVKNTIGCIFYEKYYIRSEKKSDVKIPLCSTIKRVPRDKRKTAHASGVYEKQIANFLPARAVSNP